MNCSTTSCFVIFEYVFPLLGCISGNILYAAPIATVQILLKTRKLGPVNPLPYALLFTNSMIWIVYALILKNYFIFFTNIFGVCLSLGYVMVGYGVGLSEYFSASSIVPLGAPSEGMSNDTVVSLTSLKRRLDVTMYVAIAGLGIDAVTGLVTLVSITDFDTAKLFGGSMCLVILCVFYASPLLTLLNVIRFKNTDSLDRRLAWTTVFNGTFWSVYGLAVLKDVFVYGPNMFGALVGLLQLVLMQLYPKKTVDEANEGLSETLVILSPLDKTDMQE